jgi:predicted ATPase
VNKDDHGTMPTSGALLGRYRLLAGVTQAELAAQAGYSTDYLGKLERGQRNLPAAVANRIADVLDLGDQERRELIAAAERRTHSEPRQAPLAGRTRELAEIRAHLAGLGPPFLLLSGEPGIGKTRLLDAAAQYASRGGWRVIRGGCQRRNGDPYAPLTAAISESLGDLPDGDRQSTLRDAGYLHLLLPELLDAGRAHLSDPGAGPPPAPTPPEHQRRLLFASVRKYLHAIAAEAGTLLILDDLQWAGQDGLDLLLSTAATDPPQRAPLRVLAAFRDSDLMSSARIGEFVAQLAHESTATLLALEPLSEAEAEELLCGLLPDPHGWGTVVPAVLRHAGGIPLFLVSYAEELIRRDAAGPDPDLPWTVMQVVRQRVAELPPDTRELLGLAAVTGRVDDPELLGHVMSRPKEDVLAALDRACAARLLTDEPGTYRFVHELVRETIERDLSAGRRRLWHERIGRALVCRLEGGRRESVAEIASHFRAAGEVQEALNWYVRAADSAAAVFGYEDAERHYRTAAELARELGDPRAQAVAMERLGDVLYRTGRYDEAFDLMDQASEAYERLGDRDRHLRMVARSAEARRCSGRIAEGLERILPVV